jgi:membrane protease YdiL (CAAX protease family)
MFKVEAKRIRSKLIIFILLTAAISSIFYYFMIVTGASRDFGVLLMWSPGIAAIFTQWIFRESIRDFGWVLGQRKYLFWGFTIPILYGAIIYGFAWVTGLAGFQAPSLNLFLAIPIGFVAACFAALGEEIGWRGLLIPELSRVTTFTNAALITWGLWVIWHYPAILFADYHSQAPRWFDMTTFTLAILGMSFFTAWLRLKSGSLWPVVLWHGNHNLFIQSVFLSMTTDTGLTEYIVDDFGLGVMFSALIVGFIFWRKRQDLVKSGSKTPSNVAEIDPARL